MGAKPASVEKPVVASLSHDARTPLTAMRAAVEALQDGMAPDPARYLGTDLRGADAVPLLHFPGIHPDAARWLVAERSIAAIGIDTPSIDNGQSTTFESKP